MAVRIRLTRLGSRHRYIYRLVVADSRDRRDGAVVDTLGNYNPMAKPAIYRIDQEKALEWLKKGAQPTDTARSLLKQLGIWQKFQFLKQGKTAEQADALVTEILGKRKGGTFRMASQPTAPAEKAEVSAEATS